MDKQKNLLPWVLVIGVLVFLTVVAVAVVGGVWVIQRTTQRAVQPVSNMTSELSTQVARILHPTPTVLPDPVTIINQIRPLARLETIQYTVEKVITAEVGQESLAPLFGDKLLFVGHGYVTAGIDLQDISSQDFLVEDGVIRVRLPEAEIFEATLDNDKSYVYDRETGLLTHGDVNLETTARQAAEQQIRQAALEDGILAQAQANAESYMESLLNKLGYSQVIFIRSGE
jgi:HAMP domain-containing protein